MKMAKLTRFARSQKAHSRLHRKHSSITKTASGNKYDTAFIRSNYHFAVLNAQKKKNRVLSDSEKKKIYNDIILTFY